MLKANNVISLFELFKILELVRKREKYAKLYSAMAKLVNKGVSSCSLALVLEALIDSKNIGIDKKYKDDKLKPLFEAMETEDEMYSLSNSYRLSDDGYFIHVIYEVIIYAYFGLFRALGKLGEEAIAIRNGEGLLRNDRWGRLVRFAERKTRILLEKFK